MLRKLAPTSVRHYAKEFKNGVDGRGALFTCDTWGPSPKVEK